MLTTEIGGAAPPKEKPHVPERTAALESATGRSEFNAPTESVQDREVVPLQQRESCASCGVTFQPRAPWHRTCTRCHGWLAAAIGLRRVSRLLAGAGR